MSKILHYLTSLALIGAICSTSVIENGTYGTLIFVVVWVLILLGALTATVFGVVLFTMGVIKDKFPKEVVERWKNIDKPNWWISIPLMFGWLAALVYVEWTVTAVAYLLESVVLLVLSHLMYSAATSSSKDEDDEDDEDDMIQYVKDPVVREGLYKAREEKRNN